MKMNKITRALAKNVAITAVDEMLSQMPPSEIKATMTAIWFPIKVSYLTLCDIDPREGDEFKNRVVAIVKNDPSLWDSAEFKQSLLSTLQTLTETREDKKRKVINIIYFGGYIPSGDRKSFELERLNMTAQTISLPALGHLKFVADEILPFKEKLMREKVDSMNKENRENDDEWWFRLYMKQEADSSIIDKWVHQEYNPNSTKLKAKDPRLGTDKEVSKKYFEEEAKVREHSSEMASELISLGIFRQRDALWDGGLAYSLTEFGHNFIQYVQQAG